MKGSMSTTLYFQCFLLMYGFLLAFFHHWLFPVLFLGLFLFKVKFSRTYLPTVHNQQVSIATNTISRLYTLLVWSRNAIVLIHNVLIFFFCCVCRMFLATWFKIFLHWMEQTLMHKYARILQRFGTCQAYSIKQNKGNTCSRRNSWNWYLLTEHL